MKIILCIGRWPFTSDNLSLDKFPRRVGAAKRKTRPNWKMEPFTRFLDHWWENIALFVEQGHLFVENSRSNASNTGSLCYKILTIVLCSLHRRNANYAEIVPWYPGGDSENLISNGSQAGVVAVFQTFVE